MRFLNFPTTPPRLGAVHDGSQSHRNLDRHISPASEPRALRAITLALPDLQAREKPPGSAPPVHATTYSWRCMLERLPRASTTHLDIELPCAYAIAGAKLEFQACVH